MTREENLHWIDQEIQTWENECQSKHPIKEALYAARKALEQEPCKDAVSIASVFEIMGNLMSIPYDFDRSITEKDVSESMDKIRELPRVTPQKPKTGYISIDDVMSVFDDFMCGEVDEEGTETFLEMLKDKAESEAEDGKA